MEENTDLRESVAFKEYQTGARKQIKTPWSWIIVIAIITAISSSITSIFAAIVMDNPWALNFIIGLYGLPAGFVIAFRNKTLSFLVSFRYSSYSAMIFTLIFFLFGVIEKAIFSASIGGFLINVGQISLTSLVIGLYCVFTFGLGAFIGTFVHGVRDSKR